VSGKPPFVQIAVQAFACAFGAPDVPARSLGRLEKVLERHEDVPFTGDQRAFIELVRRALKEGFTLERAQQVRGEAARLLARHVADAQFTRRAPSRGHAAFTHDLFEKDN
jgi:hypothetical protein